MTTLSAQIDGIIAACKPRAGSLAVTIFGDCISQHGQSVWLGSLIEAMELFGLNARQIRTAVFRLTDEGWLHATRRGRRSYYRLTEFGLRQYTHAAERIYAAEAAQWDGCWVLIAALGLAPGVRDELRRRLTWQGFGSLSAGVFVHPCARSGPLSEVLADLHINDEVVVWRARAEETKAVVALVKTVWRLDESAARFESFHAMFSPLVAELKRSSESEPLQAFRLRVLLIHEYRRILLKTTELPQALLAADWPGEAARELVIGLYRASGNGALRHCEAMQNEHGGLARPERSYFARFGGLDPVAPADKAHAA